MGTDMNVPASNRTRRIVKAPWLQRIQIGSGKERYLPKCAVDNRPARAEVPAQPATSRHCKSRGYRQCPHLTVSGGRDFQFVNFDSIPLRHESNGYLVHKTQLLPG